MTDLVYRVQLFNQQAGMWDTFSWEFSSRAAAHLWLVENGLKGGRVIQLSRRGYNRATPNG